jgi:hypothetical protein
MAGFKDLYPTSFVLGVDDCGDAVAMLTVWGILRGVSVQ